MGSSTLTDESGDIQDRFLASQTAPSPHEKRRTRLNAPEDPVDPTWLGLDYQIRPEGSELQGGFGNPLGATLDLLRL